MSVVELGAGSPLASAPHVLGNLDIPRFDYNFENIDGACVSESRREAFVLHSARYERTKCMSVFDLRTGACVRTWRKVAYLPFDRSHRVACTRRDSILIPDNGGVILELNAEDGEARVFARLIHERHYGCWFDAQFISGSRAGVVVGNGEVVVVYDWSGCEAWFMRPREAWNDWFVDALIQDDGNVLLLTASMVFACDVNGEVLWTRQRDAAATSAGLARCFIVCYDQRQDTVVLSTKHVMAVAGMPVTRRWLLFFDDTYDRRYEYVHTDELRAQFVASAVVFS